MVSELPSGMFLLRVHILCAACCVAQTSSF